MRVELHTDDRLTAHLSRIAHSTRDLRRVYRAAGGAAATQLRRHFIAKNSKFWETIRDRVGAPIVDETGATVPVASPELLHKITGGIIAPKRGDHLAIPATERAKKAGQPSSMDDASFLEFIPIPNRPKLAGALVERVAPRRTAPRKPKAAKRPARAKKTRTTAPDSLRERKVWYWLVRYVEQRPDPAAMPPPRKMHAAINQAARGLLRAIKDGVKK